MFIFGLWRASDLITATEVLAQCISAKEELQQPQQICLCFCVSVFVCVCVCVCISPQSCAIIKKHTLKHPHPETSSDQYCRRFHSPLHYREIPAAAWHSPSDLIALTFKILVHLQRWSQLQTMKTPNPPLSFPHHHRSHRRDRSYKSSIKSIKANGPEDGRKRLISQAVSPADPRKWTTK